jgi:hypothetical protein
MSRVVLDDPGRLQSSASKAINPFLVSYLSTAWGLGSGMIGAVVLVLTPAAPPYASDCGLVLRSLMENY